MFDSPFNSRYGSNEMRSAFSDVHRHTTWRKLWIKLARAEYAMGLPVTPAQIAEMENHIDEIDYKAVADYELKTKHDVMAHILAYGDVCPLARPIIHLGATSCYVTDNTDVILQREAMRIIRVKLNSLITGLRMFAIDNISIPTTGYTHMQVAQPTTVGKRAALWLQDLMLDRDQIVFQMKGVKMLGCRGATGSASSFLELFDGDRDKVKKMERIMFGDKVFKVSGQTYTRKQDYNVMNVLSGIAQSASKFANDIRFLSSLKEVYERKQSGQVGSSAMPYKVNPIDAEKINSLSRYVINGVQVFAMNTATQFMERTLDDSANRRIMIPEMFMATDEILNTYRNVVNNLYVDRPIISKHMSESMYKMLEEPIMMRAVLNGEDRQDVHKELGEGGMSTMADASMVGRLTGLSQQQVFDLIDGK